MVSKVVKGTIVVVLIVVGLVILLSALQILTVVLPPVKVGPVNPPVHSP